MASEITAFAPNGAGSRARSFVIDGVRVSVRHEDDDERCEAMAEFLAAAPKVIADLRSEVQRLLALVPAKDRSRLLGHGCVRMKNRELWLLSRQDRGWGEFGVRLDGWDDLFRRFNVVVTSRGQDAFGEFWIVEDALAKEAADAP